MAFIKKRNDKSRSGSKSKKREPPISFRATQEERAKIQTAADREGLTVGSYVRSRALRKPTTRAVRRPPVQTAQLAQLLGLIGAVGGDLQLIARRLAGAQSVTEMEVRAALTEFREAAASILPLLGKRRHDH